MAIIVYEKPQVIIIYNTKSAQTSLFKIFGGTQGMIRGESWDENADTYFKKPWFKTPESKISEFPNYFTAIFVRNPYSRMLSMWSYIKYHTPDIVPDFAGWLQISYEDWQNGTPARLQYPLPASYFVDDKTKIDFIGKQEHLDRNVKQLLHHFHIEYKGMPFLNKSLVSKNIKWYTHELKQMVDEMYAEDFELFSYPMKLPHL